MAGTAAVGLLYSAGDVFASRRCFGLAYQSQKQQTGAAKHQAGQQDQNEAERRLQLR
jgi:hypothetical protein